MTTTITGDVVLTTDRSESSYGIPVLVLSGTAYGPADKLPWGSRADKWVCDIVSGGIQKWWDQEVARRPLLGKFTNFIA